MRAALVSAGLALALVGALAAPAHAYPQLVLSHDQSCSGCHLSPAGGGLLNENGLNTAESISQLGTSPEFLNGAVTPPKWLALGADFRGAAGYLQSPVKTLSAFPMQADLYGAATFGAISIHVTLGYRPTENGNEAATAVWAREHYVMWQQHPGEAHGLFIRAGRFMPVYGIRLAEHEVYTRKYGNAALYSDTYGIHAAKIEDKYEAHLSAFIRDPIIDPVDHANGVMAYAEYKPTHHLALGGEGMLRRSPTDTKFGGGIVVKAYAPGPKLLVQGEVQYINQVIDKGAYDVSGGAPLRIVGYLLGTWMPKEWLWVDLGLGHYDSNIRIKYEDRDNADLNIHWIATSHIELVLANRLEMLSFGKGGPSDGYSLLMLHYRL